MESYIFYPTPPSNSESEESSNAVYSSPNGSPMGSPFITPSLDCGEGTSTDPTVVKIEPGSLEESPYLTIIEEPFNKFRFRYKSEQTGTHGALPGENHSKQKPTSPTVQLNNFEDYNVPTIIRCSLYQINLKGPHAHRLVKKSINKEGEDEDPHEICLNPGENTAVFSNMAISHTAKKDNTEVLVRKRQRLKKEEVLRNDSKRILKELNLHEKAEVLALVEKELKEMDMNKVCLRFDAFAMFNEGELHPICTPIYSQVINNLKSAETGDLKICRMDHITSPASGGKEIFLLVEKVKANNILVRFYELNEDLEEVWSDYGKFTELDVHHQYAIVLKTPPYIDQNITEEVPVFVELIRKKDMEKSESRHFKYVPNTESYQPYPKKGRFSEKSEKKDFLITEDSSNFIIQSNDFLSDLYQEIEDALPPDDFRSIFEDQLATDSAYGKEMAMDLLQRQFSTTIICENDETPRIRKMDVLLLEDERVFSELSCFLKTNPATQRIKPSFKKYLDIFKSTNAFHIALMKCNEKVINFFMNQLVKYELYSLFNIQNEHLETPLSIAVETNNFEIVKQLLGLNCKIHSTTPNDKGNTPLHVALQQRVCSKIIDALLSAKDFEKGINFENFEGDTPLIVAIKMHNLDAVKKICEKGAKITNSHKSNGYTPLRFSIEHARENVKTDCLIFKYLLYLPEQNVERQDFSGVRPLEVVLKHKNVELRNLALEYMDKNNLIMGETEIKSEIESDEEEMVIDDLNDKYNNITKFTPECLDKICNMLDLSDNWQNLADLLDLGHLVQKYKINLANSPSRQLIHVALSTKSATVKEIRDFLENLDEMIIVEIIDQMVKDS